MTLEELYIYADKAGVDVDMFPMRAVKALSLPEGCVALNPRKIKSSADEKATLAHEIGHVETGAFYNVYSKFDVIAQCERRADRRAAELLVPRKALRRAIKRGIVEPWELADLFGVPERFLRRVLDIYEHRSA